MGYDQLSESTRVRKDKHGCVRKEKRQRSSARCGGYKCYGISRMHCWRMLPGDLEGHAPSWPLEPPSPGTAGQARQQWHPARDVFGVPIHVAPACGAPKQLPGRLSANKLPQSPTVCKQLAGGRLGQFLAFGTIQTDYSPMRSPPAGVNNARSSFSSMSRWISLTLPSKNAARNPAVNGPSRPASGFLGS